MPGCPPEPSGGKDGHERQLTCDEQLKQMRGSAFIRRACGANEDQVTDNDAQGGERHGQRYPGAGVFQRVVVHENPIDMDGLDRNALVVCPWRARDAASSRRKIVFS